MDEKPEPARVHNSLKLERLELALRASNEGIWDWWTDTKAILYSRRILELLECGNDRAPNLFLPPYEHIRQEERLGFEKEVTKVLADGGPEFLAVDARVRTGSDNWCWLRIRGTVVRNRDGRAIRIVGSMIDISRRKSAEGAVEEERSLLKQLIDNIPLKVYFKDMESRFVMANQGTAEGMGCADASELIGKHDRDFFQDEHWMRAFETEQEIIRTQEPVIDLLEHETWQNAPESWVITSKFPWRDRKGRIKGTFGVSSDVTRLVRAEQEASDLALQLRLKNAAYEEEVLLAREIQQALARELIPAAQADPRCRISFGARYIPCSGLAGDFFEVMELGGNRHGVLICDVMGHGVRSALIVAMLRGLLEKQRALSAEPGLFLQGLNDGLAAILERAGTTLFATAFFGVIDLEKETLEYACAGHPGPVIAGKNGVRQIAAASSEKGPGLGLIRGCVYPTGKMALSEIDRMVLFTDGILEAENRSGEPFFEERLLEVIAAGCAGSVESLLDGTLAGVVAFAGGQGFEDDVCLLGVGFERAE